MSTLALENRQEKTERNSKLVAAIVTTIVAIALLLLFILYKIITPVPAIPPPEDVPTVELGIDNSSGGDMAPTMGGGSQGNTGHSGSQLPSGGNPDPTPLPQTPGGGAITGPDASNASAPTGDPKASAALMAAIATYNKNKGTASIKVGGEGTEPYGSGIGDHPHDQTGPGTGDPGGPGGHGGHSTCSRSIVSRPDIVNPTQEEGKVLVNVYVNRQGKVTKTEVNAAGTTTLNAVLRSTATQSAYQIKFNEDETCAELVVLPIEINFTLK